MLLLIARAIYVQYEHPQRESSQANYGVLFASLYRQDIHNVRVVDAGVDNSENLVNYAPQLRFYALLWGAKGLKVRISPDLTALRWRSDDVIATCDPRWVAVVPRLGQETGAASGCVAVRSKPDLAND